MLRCKRCGGFVYEEEIFYEDDGKKHMQLGCYSCPQKVYVEFRKWRDFKNRLYRAIDEGKNKKR